MEQSLSWYANQFSASQEIPCILWKPKIHYPIQNRTLPVPTLRQINPVHTQQPTSLRTILTHSLPAI
jgi:hypothetical protein